MSKIKSYLAYSLEYVKHLLVLQVTKIVYPTYYAFRRSLSRFLRAVEFESYKEWEERTHWINTDKYVKAKAKKNGWSNASTKGYKRGY